MKWVFDIDIVGGCNLRCRSCPIGNSDLKTMSKNNMSLEMIDNIMKKAKFEFGNPIIQLYNWTEPLLHPNLDKIIKIVKSYELRCMVSTNLNISRNLENIILSEPDEFLISVSGFSQKIYSQMHKRGDIEKVKKNMIKVSEIIKKNKLKIQPTLRYHLYDHSVKEKDLMKEFCDQLGFIFLPNCTYFLPIEKLLKRANSEIIDDVIFTKEDSDVCAKILPKLDKIFPLCKKVNDDKCLLMDTHIALTSDGKVMPCCGLFDQSKYAICDYLSTPIEEIRVLKSKQSICHECIKHDINKYMTINLMDLARKVPYDKFMHEN